jgi:hypothetical protein
MSNQQSKKNHNKKSDAYDTWPKNEVEIEKKVQVLKTQCRRERKEKREFSKEGCLVWVCKVIVCFRDTSLETVAVRIMQR